MFGAIMRTQLSLTVFAGLAGSLLLCLVGCGGDDGPAFPEVRVDPAEVAANVVAQFDKDGDGEISPSELKKSKGLLKLTKGESQLMQEYRLDSDGSGTVSEEEFTKKFTDCFADLRQGYSCHIDYRGEPLEGATVTLIPEEFMGDIPEASAETDSSGNCSVGTADGLDGAVPGIYKITITHPETKIPAKYNDKSTFSVALDPTNPYATEGVPTFNIR